MYSRKRFDISWTDLAAGLGACLFARGERAAAGRIERWFASPAPPGAVSAAVACLSLRSGFDLWLRLLDLPRGSEILVSALTIPDMGRVIEHHGLVPVPVDVDASTLAPRLERMRALAGPRTRAMLVAHLFGTRIDLAPYADLAREKGLLLLEDCAQAFGDDYRGHPRADVAMFSFGPIKTATALAGGVLVLRDAALGARLRQEQARYPRQSTWAYAGRLLKYAALKAVSARALYGAFVGLCKARGRSIDDVIQGTVRGFHGGDLFAKLRRRPCPALLWLLGRRLEHADGVQVRARAARGRELRARIDHQCEIPGAQAGSHSYWVFPVLAEEPEAMVQRLRGAGFDATRAATLCALPVPAGRSECEPREAQSIVQRTVYVPLYPELGQAALQRMAGVLLANRAKAVSPTG